MKAELTNLLNTTSAPEVVLSHKGENLTFSVSCFGRRNLDQGFNIFEHINKYWESLTPADQDFIFDLYREISYLFQNVWDRSALTLQLNKKVVALLNFHNFDMVYDWVVLKSDIIIPSTFETEYNHSVDRQGSRDQTYIRSDYTKLITVTLILRSIVPVWGTFIAHTRQETGTIYKELYAFSLLTHSDLLKTESFNKLRVFIDRTVGPHRYNPSSIIDGISSEDYPNWMLALVVIRRLCVGDIRGLDPRANLVTFIHKFITSRMNGTDISADNMVKPKSYDDASSDMDLKLSSLERYKIKHDISIGSIMELMHSLSDLRSVAQRLAFDMTDELFNDSIESAQKLVGKRLLNPQITLMRWIMKPVISPRGIMYLSKDLSDGSNDIIVNALGITQAVLIARGHPFLGLLATSYANIHELDPTVGIIGSKVHIPKDMVAELDKLYPYHRMVGGKKSNQKPVNLVIKAIENMYDDLSMFSWTMSASDLMIESIMGKTNTRRITIPGDIKVQLARLVIEIGKQLW